MAITEREHDDRADATDHSRPIGREAVMAALVEATISAIVEEGLHVSVRDLARAAGVNHGLVHTYFGNKQGLITAALDEINARAAVELDASGYPPADLASRHDGLLAKAIARIGLDPETPHDVFTSHPISGAWREALKADRADVEDPEIDLMVASASALGLGWAIFAEHITRVLDIDEPQRAQLDAQIADIVAELGGLPDTRS